LAGVVYKRERKTRGENRTVRQLGEVYDKRPRQRSRELDRKTEKESTTKKESGKEILKATDKH